MISLEDALRLIEDNLPESGRTRVAVEDSIGYTLCEDIVSDIDVVSFRNSAMDGYAVCSGWLARCSRSDPVTLPCHDTVFAGESDIAAFREGMVVKIMTGAPIPEGYDAVVKIEDTNGDNGNVNFREPIEPGANVRHPGADIQRGQMLFTEGHVVRVLDVGVLAGIGLTRVPVYARPSVLVATTGNEHVLPGSPLARGEIYNSNLYTVSSLVRPFSDGLETISTVTDDPQLLRGVLQRKHDVIVTTGGVSAGERDMVVSTAVGEGWLSVFHKVRIKPGKPVYFARKGKQLLFGLPGNPLSAAVTCAMLVIPALKRICGRTDLFPVPSPARLGKTPIRQCRRTLVWPGRLRRETDGVVADFSPKELSQSLSALLGSDGLIIQGATTDTGSSRPAIGVLWWDDLLR
ncbi:MAG: molybdopterin molybdotransferase MoeA [bacterium]